MLRFICCWFLYLQGDATSISGLSGTLYLGKLPTKPADGYVGVLPSRPPASPKVSEVGWVTMEVGRGILARHTQSRSQHFAEHNFALLCRLLQGTAVVGLQLGTQQPLFALIVAGDNIYAASGSTALLQVLLLFLRLCQLELGGALGGRHIQHLELAHVLKPYRWAARMRAKHPSSRCGYPSVMCSSLALAVYSQCAPMPLHVQNLDHIMLPRFAGPSLTWSAARHA